MCGKREPGRGKRGVGGGGKEVLNRPVRVFQFNFIKNIDVDL